LLHGYQRAPSNKKMHFLTHLSNGPSNKKARICGPFGWRGRDSNPRPSGYEEDRGGYLATYLQALCDFVSRNLRLNFVILLDGLLDEISRGRWLVRRFR
jgi:hypothetical protein